MDPLTKTVTSYTVTLDDEQGRELRAGLEKKDFTFKKVAHAHFGASRGKLSLTYYRSGKLLIQGKETAEFVQFFLEPEILKEIRFGYEEVLSEPAGERIGVDESGKGDYFGPLVVAGVYLNDETEKKLRDLNVRDSKKISARRIQDLRRIIRKECRYSVVAIGPERYNQLYNTMGNLNRILAWGHARVIENILSKTSCPKAILDQFGRKDLVLRALMKKGRSIEVEQRVRGEADLAVAAASVLARGEFVLRLKKLSEEFGVKLPLGNKKDLVIAAGKEIIRKEGMEALVRVAKVQFKTTREILDA
jgi:ribonuclease HIII